MSAGEIHDQMTAEIQFERRGWVAEARDDQRGFGTREAIRLQAEVNEAETLMRSLLENGEDVRAKAQEWLDRRKEDRA